MISSEEQQQRPAQKEQDQKKNENKSPITRLEAALVNLAFVVAQRGVRPEKAEVALLAKRIVELEERVNVLLEDTLEKEERAG